MPLNIEIRPQKSPYLARRVRHRHFLLAGHRRERDRISTPDHLRRVLASSPRASAPFDAVVVERGPPGLQERLLAQDHGQVDRGAALHQRQQVVRSSHLRRRLRSVVAPSSSSSHERADQPPDGEHAQEPEDRGRLLLLLLLLAAASSGGSIAPSDRGRHYGFFFFFLIVNACFFFSNKQPYSSFFFFLFFSLHPPLFLYIDSKTPSLSLCFSPILPRRSPRTRPPPREQPGTRRSSRRRCRCCFRRA